MTPAKQAEREDNGSDAGSACQTPAATVLSEGAGVALGNVLSRLIEPSVGEGQRRKTTGKRPRADRKPVVLADNEDVRDRLQREREDNKRLKLLRMEKMQFEKNARVIPNVTLNATLEKALLGTATKGAVALFNAVAKAQKAADELSAKEKKKGPPVSRDNFMNMMKASVTKSMALPAVNPRKQVDDGLSADEGIPASASAKWLKDDFLTAGAEKLKQWDQEGGNADSSSEDGDDELEDEREGDEGSSSDDDDNDDDSDES